MPYGALRALKRVQRDPGGSVTFSEFSYFPNLGGYLIQEHVLVKVVFSPSLNCSGETPPSRLIATPRPFPLLRSDQEQSLLNKHFTNPHIIYIPTLTYIHDIHTNTYFSILFRAWDKQYCNSNSCSASSIPITYVKFKQITNVYVYVYDEICLLQIIFRCFKVFYLLAIPI